MVDEITPEVVGNTGRLECMCLSWSSDGQTLFAGYTDNLIRVYDVEVL